MPQISVSISESRGDPREALRAVKGVVLRIPGGVKQEGSVLGTVLYGNVVDYIIVLSFSISCNSPVRYVMVLTWDGALTVTFKLISTVGVVSLTIPKP